MRSGILRRRAAERALLLALPLLLAGCFYSFSGGGLPRHIRTIAVEPFETTAAEPQLSSQFQTKLQEQLSRTLGVRIVDASVADAVVRGRITGYQETAPNVRPAGADGRADVVQSEVVVSFEAEIFDLRENRPIWQGRGLSGRGTLQPGTQDFTVGRTRAIEDMVRKVIDGAQSQW
jgi:hypothetical protein